MGRKVAIVGLDPLNRDYANAVAEDVEYWGLNEGHLYLARTLRIGRDRWFQLHERTVKTDFGMAYDTGRPGFYHEHEMFLQKCGIPVYTTEIDPVIPTSVRYPMEDILAHFNGRGYFTSGMDYMVALALYEHDRDMAIEELHVYGINLRTGTELIEQRPGMEYWLGRAEGSGITIKLPENSTLLKAPLYGRGKEWHAINALKQRWGSLHIQFQNLQEQTRDVKTRLEETEMSLVAMGVNPDQVGIPVSDAALITGNKLKSGIPLEHIVSAKVAGDGQAR